jgi:hypothetical protein
MTLHAKPPADEDHDGDEHQHFRAAHRDPPPARARPAPTLSRRALSGDAMSRPCLLPGNLLPTLSVKYSGMLPG